MQARTILVLVVLLVGLGAVAWLQREEALADPDGLADLRVFDGAPLDSIGAIEVDHLERHWSVRLEVDGRGNWFVTDPIAYRASDGVVKRLVGMIRDLRGLEVADVERPQAVGLEPPRAVITIEPRSVEGAAGEPVVVELGAVDLDGNAVWVRAGGRILRTLRSLDNVLLGGVQDFRSKRLVETSILARPIELSRRGSLEPGGPDLSFEAQREGATWRATSPHKITLDPATVYLYHQEVFSARLVRFHDDDPRDLSAYGLAEPRLSLDVRTARGDDVGLRFGQVEGDPDTWYAMRAGHPFVWTVSPRDVTFLATPLEDLYDYRIVRAKRSDIVSVRLEGGGGAVRLFRVGEQWRATRAADTPVEELVDSDWIPADEARVEDVLAVLERSELADYLAPGTAFRPRSPRERLTVETAAGDVFGGELGAEHAVQGSETARTFLRAADELVALVPDEVAALVHTPFEELRSRVVHRLVEREQKSVTLRLGERELVYELARDENLWRTRGTTLEATAFAAVVDRLLSIRAVRWLEPGEVEPDELEWVDLDLRAIAGPPTRARIARTPDGTELVETSGRLAEIRPGLVVPVRALFGGS